MFIWIKRIKNYIKYDLKCSLTIKRWKVCTKKGTRFFRTEKEAYNNTDTMDEFVLGHLEPYGWVIWDSRGIESEETIQI